MRNSRPACPPSSLRFLAVISGLIVVMASVAYYQFGRVQRTTERRRDILIAVFGYGTSNVLGLQVQLNKAEELGRGSSFPFDAFFLALAHHQLGQKDEARQWYDAADRWRQTFRANDKELQGFQSEAADLLKPKRAPVIARRAGDDPELNFYTFLLDTNPQAVWAAWAYDQRSEIHQRLHHIEQARADRLKAAEIYTQTIKANPNSWTAHFQRADNYAELEKWREAAADFQGRTVIFYSWGNQQGTEFLAQAAFGGSLANFLGSFFP